MVDDVTNKREGTFITCLNFYIYIELVYSMLSNSGGRKSSSGRRLEIIAALPRIMWRDIFWISWPIVSLSSGRASVPRQCGTSTLQLADGQGVHATKCLKGDGEEDKPLLSGNQTSQHSLI